MGIVTAVGQGLGATLVITNGLGMMGNAPAHVGTSLAATPAGMPLAGGAAMAGGALLFAFSSFASIDY